MMYRLMVLFQFLEERGTAMSKVTKLKFILYGIILIPFAVSIIHYVYSIRLVV